MCHEFCNYGHRERPLNEHSSLLTFERPAMPQPSPTRKFKYSIIFLWIFIALGKIFGIFLCYNLYSYGMFSICSPGTRIVYDRTFLLQMRNSPLARTPPRNLPVIPGITTDAPAQVLPKSPLSNSLVKTGKKTSNTKIPLSVIFNVESLSFDPLYHN